MLTTHTAVALLANHYTPRKPIIVTDTAGNPIGRLTGINQVNTCTPRWTGDPTNELVLDATVTTTPVPYTADDLLVLLAEHDTNDIAHDAVVRIQLGATISTVIDIDNSALHILIVTDTDPPADDAIEPTGTITVPAALIHQLLTTYPNNELAFQRALDALRHHTLNPENTPTTATSNNRLVPVALTDTLGFVDTNYDMYTDTGDETVTAAITSHVTNIINGAYTDREAALTDLTATINTLANTDGTREIRDTEPRAAIAASITPAYIAAGWGPVNEWSV
jgi:hypothetical protein